MAIKITDQIFKHKILLSVFLLPIIFFLLHCPAFGQADNATVSGEDWLGFRGNPAHTGKSSLAGPPEEIEMKWRWRMNDDKSPVSASPSITSDGTVYIATEGGDLAAINPGGGEGWVYNVSGSVKSTPAVNTNGDVLAITEDGYVFYVAANGELKWKSDFDVSIISSPVIEGDTAYFGTDDKSLVAITLTPEVTGIESDSKKLLKSEVIQWTFVADDPVKSSPAFSGNTVFFGSGNFLYAINPTAAGGGAVGGGDNTTSPSPSQLKWKYDINADIRSSPAVSNGRVYVGADDGYLYALNEVEGGLIWKRKTGDRIRSSPAIGEVDGVEIVYIGSDDGRLYAYDERGELQWMFPVAGAIRSSPAVDGNGDIYFGSDDGFIYALFPDGSLKWKSEYYYKVRSSPAIGPDKRLYVGSDNGFLYCIGESTEEDREPEIQINVSLSLSAIENNGNPVTISASLTSESQGQEVLSRIDSVTVDLRELNLFGCKSDGLAVDESGALRCDATGTITQELMFDDGKFEDDVAGDGTFTYAFGITDEPTLVGYNEGIFAHFLFLGVEVGPVPIMITVTDLYGNRVSRPVALNIDQKLIDSPDSTSSIINGLNHQTLNISFSSGTPSILSVTPNQGSPGERVTVAILGQNTNFTKNRTKVEIFNDAGFPIAAALPENDDVDVFGDTSLSAVLNIVNTEEVTAGGLTGRWDVIVTTDLPSGRPEEVIGEDLFEISGGFAKIEFRATEATVRSFGLQNICEFLLDITDENGSRPKGSPWRINIGYSREITIERAQSGTWNFDVTAGSCFPVPTFKIVTTGSNFGFLTGEVRDGFTGEGVDNATITAITGEGLASDSNVTRSSGGGYYLLPLSAAENSYTVTASKSGLIDIEREVQIEDDQETRLNFSLKPDLECPLAALAKGSSLKSFYQFRDSVLSQTPDGSRWTELYYKHAGEVRRIFTACPEIRARSSKLVRAAIKEIPQLINKGKISCNLNPDVDALIDALAEKGSPGLKKSLNAERENILRFLQKLKEGKILY